MQIELADCTNVIIRECGMPELTQADIAETYAMAIVSSWPTDWAKVNEAIQRRWPKGLERIKKRAWKIIEEKQRERTEQRLREVGEEFLASMGEPVEDDD